MRSIFLLLFCFITVSIASAQLNCPPPFGKKSGKSSSGDGAFQLTLGAGLTDLKGDIPKANSFGIGTYLNLDYRFYKGVYAGLRSQFGSLKAKGSNFDVREMDSRYLGFGAGFYVHPFELILSSNSSRQSESIGRDILEAFYVGADVLYVSNTIKSINRNNLIDNSFYGPIKYYNNNGVPIFKNTVTSLMLPSVNVGFAPALNKIRDNRRVNGNKTIYRLVFNAQFNYGNNDDLDGYVAYDKNMKSISKGNDKYNFYSLGLRITF